MKPFTGELLLSRAVIRVTGRISVGPDGVHRGHLQPQGNAKLTSGNYRLKLPGGEEVEIALMGKVSTRSYQSPLYFEGKQGHLEPSPTVG